MTKKRAKEAVTQDRALDYGLGNARQKLQSPITNNFLKNSNSEHFMNSKV